MAVISIGPFGGVNHAQHGRYNTQIGQAECAENTCLSDGVLRPHKCPEEVCDAGSDIAQIYESSLCECVTFETRRPIARCLNRVYQIQDGTLVESTESDFCNDVTCLTGVPCPSSPPSVSGASGASSECSTYFGRFRYTLVKDYGGRCEEGPPSPSTGTVCFTSSDRLSFNAPIPNTGHCVTGVRIYVAISGHHSGQENTYQNESEWMYVGDGGATTLNPETLGIGPVTWRHFLPPSNLDGLVCTKEGLAVWKNDRIYLSQPGTGYGYNDYDELCLGDNIKHMVQYNNDLYVWTDNYQFYLRRIAPNKYETIELSINQDLISPRSVALTPSGVLFQGQHGVFTWSQGQLIGLMETIIHRNQWCNYRDEDSIAVFLDDRYIFTANGKLQIFHLDTNDFYSIDIDVDDLYVTSRGQLQYAVGSTIYSLDLCCESGCDPCMETSIDICAERCPYLWRSKVFTTQVPHMWTAAKVRLDARTGTVVFRLYTYDCGEKKLVIEKEINTDEINCPLFEFRIPGCIGLYTDYMVELEGDAHVYFAVLAHSFSEMGQAVN